MSFGQYANFKQRPLGATGWKVITETKTLADGTDVTTTRYDIPRQEVFCRFELGGYGKGELCQVRQLYKDGRHQVLNHLKDCHPAEHAKQPKTKPGKIPNAVKNDENVIFTEQMRLIREYNENGVTASVQNSIGGAGFTGPPTPQKRSASAMTGGADDAPTPTKKGKATPFDANNPPADWVEITDKIATFPVGRGNKPMVSTMRTEIRERRWAISKDKGAKPCPACRQRKSQCPPGQYVDGKYWDTTSWSDSDCWILSGYNGPEVAENEPEPEPEQEQEQQGGN